MNTARNVYGVTVMAMVAVASLLSVPGPASASAPADEIRVAEISPATIKAHAQRADKVSRSDSAGRSKVREYLDDQARRGRLLNEQDVHVASVANPLRPGRQVHFAWDGASTPRLLLQEAGDADVGGMAVAATREEAGSGPASGRFGAGYDGAVAWNNMYLSNNECYFIYFDSYYSSLQHQLVSCFEKWAQPGSDHWVYNRWSLWTRADDGPTPYYARTKELTIRARPSKGVEWKVKKLNSWAPAGPSQSCQELGNISIGGSYASISVPIRTCNTTQLSISPKAIGIKLFEGSYYGTMRQHRIDVVGDFTANDRYVVPSFADYNWVEVAYFRAGCGVCGENVPAYTWRDSGW